MDGCNVHEVEGEGPGHEGGFHEEPVADDGGSNGICLHVLVGVGAVSFHGWTLVTVNDAAEKQVNADIYTRRHLTPGPDLLN